MTAIRRIFVEKKTGFDIEAQELARDLRENLGISTLTGVRICKRYDVAGLNEDEFRAARVTVFSEPPLDKVYLESLPLENSESQFAIEYLPGQFDQRADAAMQCLQITTLKKEVQVAAAQVIVLQGKLQAQQIDKIKKYLINPVDSHEAVLEKPDTLARPFHRPEKIETLTGFITLDQGQLAQFLADRGLAMSLADLQFCQHYFRDEEKRDPTIAEIKMLDTYWSDHCRHTTFQAIVDDVKIADSPWLDPLRQALEKFQAAQLLVAAKKNAEINLMNIATMSMKEMKARGKLADLEDSPEINACSIIRDVVVDGRTEKWLIMFKNETHNHPTEIEPFGGAATCLGGAIRDPLSGRAFVYQAMRVTGSGDPRQPVAETLAGKLSQFKISTEAAHGFSAYGNQIGLATGQVQEYYDPGYVAKRMEIGAVIGAVPINQVKRSEPVPGDVILLVGGRTGRDGIGGATGSSKAHTASSLQEAGAEVQKGNAPEERKLQRLFRHPQVTRLIKRCNDFGAGGVSVAIGELADGLEIDLDRVPRKYEGLDGAELALSESQERMAVVLDPADVEKFQEWVRLENLEATAIAKVTADQRLRMSWQNQQIINISRDFINTHGVQQHCRIEVAAPDARQDYFANPMANREKSLSQAWLNNISNLNVCCQMGLVERFDSTIGSGSVLMPFGGKYQLTPSEVMVAKVPVLQGDTLTGTVMAHGFHPEIGKWSPFHGGFYAVAEAACKIAAAGGDYRTLRYTLQEYFEKLGRDPKRWGKPFAALLGAYHALTELGVAAIGGKDSMSGSFHDLDVPPTLVAFAVTMIDLDQVVSPEFKKPGHPVLWLQTPRTAAGISDMELLKRNLALVHELTAGKKVCAGQAIRHGGLAAALSKMCLGNRIGFQFSADLKPDEYFNPAVGSFLLELADDVEPRDILAKTGGQILGHTWSAPEIKFAQLAIPLTDILTAWQEPLSRVFPIQAQIRPEVATIPAYEKKSPKAAATKIVKPRVIIPVFPGNNCEYDTQLAFQRAGAQAEVFIFRNLTTSEIDESLSRLRQEITQSQIIMIPGGFSSGDEPDGSGKFIAAVFRNPRIRDAVHDLLNKRDGLMLGICNGFQALIKLGLLPHGEICDLEPGSPTLTFNTIGRHMSRLIHTRLVSTLSPWFSLCQPGSVHTVAVSHGEGRFVASPEVIAGLISRGQVAAQYVDLDGNPAVLLPDNPNGSCQAIEGITSPDGRILGKMAHSERFSRHVFQNVPGEKNQPIFASGVRYFQ